MWRLSAARALAWALLLGGWVGLGSIVQVLAVLTQRTNLAARPRFDSWAR